MITCICGYEAPLAEYEAAGACEDCIICPECNIQIVYTGSHAWVHECDDNCPEYVGMAEKYVVAMKEAELHKLAEELGYEIEGETSSP